MVQVDGRLADVPDTSDLVLESTTEPDLTEEERINRIRDRSPGVAPEERLDGAKPAEVDGPDDVIVEGGPLEGFTFQEMDDINEEERMCVAARKALAAARDTRTRDDHKQRRYELEGVVRKREREIATSAERAAEENYKRVQAAVAGRIELRRCIAAERGYHF